MDLQLLTWNVHGFVGSDQRRDPQRTFEALRELDADVVALQEVEGRDWTALAIGAGYDAVHLPTVGVSYGNVLLSRLPIRDVRRIDLSVPAREPRGALDVTLAGEHRPLRVVATHLGLRAAERRFQARHLVHHIEPLPAEATVVLMGDLNDWTPWGRQLAPFVQAIGPLSRIPTFPSRRPMLALDRVASRGLGVTAEVGVVSDAPIRLISDHLPLRVHLHTTRDGATA